MYNGVYGAYKPRRKGFSPLRIDYIDMKNQHAILTD